MRTVSVLFACLITVALAGAGLVACGTNARPPSMMNKPADMTQIFPGCPNTIIDEGETDVDCGGPMCATRCAEGQICKVKTDCATGICVLGACAPANICSDGVKNGDESDKDCGGSCTPCLFDQACAKPADCLSATCVAAKCGKLKASLMAGKARTMGVNPINVAAGDFDGDGKLDLVALSGSEETMAVALGNGDGSFKAPTMLPIPSAESPDTLAVGDLDGDGKADIVYTNAGQVFVLLADTPMMSGQVLFKKPVPTLIGSDPGSPTLVDVDKDGKLDLVSLDTSYDANLNGYNVWISFNVGAGKWKVGKRVFNPDDRPSSPVIVDFDGDDKLDIAVIFGGKVNVALQKADGNFGPGWVPSTTGMLSATQIVGAEFNNTFDFYQDVVVLDRNGSAYGLMSGAGGGSLSRPAKIASMNGPSRMALVDFDLDSLPDFVTANYDNDTAGVYLGNGSGQLMPGPVASANTSPTYIIAADINKDGKPDLVTANPSIDLVTVLLNKSM